MYPDYEKEKRKIKDLQKTAYLNDDNINILKLFAKRHMLAALYYEVDHEFPLEQELEEIGTKMVEWCELEFNSESTIEDDGFAPKNVKNPWALSAFLFNSEPYIVNAEVAKKAMEAKEKALLLPYREPEILEDGIITPVQAEEASLFLNELRNVLLIRDDEIEIGRKTWLSKPGINDEEERIIKEYLQIYIASKWQATLEENVEQYAIAELFKENIKNDILNLDEKDLEKLAESVNEYKTDATKQLASVMAKSGIGSQEQLDQKKAEKRKEIIKIIRRRSLELSTKMVNTILDKGRKSQRLLSDFRQEQQKGWDEINATGRFGIASQFLNVGTDIVALAGILNEPKFKKDLTRLQYKDPAKRAEWGEPVAPPKVDFRAEKSGIRDLRNYAEEQKKLDSDWWASVEPTLNMYGKAWNCLKLTYGMLKPMMLICSILFPGAMPIGYLGAFFQILQIMTYIGYILGILQNTFGDFDLSEIMAAAEETPSSGGQQAGYFDYVGTIIKTLFSALKDMFVTVFILSCQLIGSLSTFILSGDGGRYLIMFVAVINIIVTLSNVTMDYLGRGGKAGFKTAVLNANLELKSDLEGFTFDVGELEKEIQDEFEGGTGNIKEVSKKLTALTQTIEKVMVVKAENRSKAKESALIAGVATQQRIADTQEKNTETQQIIAGAQQEQTTFAQRMAAASTGALKIAKGKFRESKKDKAEKKKVAVFESSLPSIDGMMPMSVVSRFQNLLGRVPKDIKKKAEKADLIRRFENVTGKPYIEEDNDEEEDMPPLNIQEDSDEEDDIQEERGGRKMGIMTPA